MTTIIARRKADGTLVQVMPDGSEQPMSGKTNWAAFDALTDEEVTAAALADPDAQPMTDEQLARMRPVAKSKRIRWKLGLSREDFAARYRIPLDIITAWERYEAEPDAIAQAYLDVIAANPRGVLNVLMQRLSSEQTVGSNSLAQVSATEFSARPQGNGTITLRFGSYGSVGSLSRLTQARGVIGESGQDAENAMAKPRNLYSSADLGGQHT